MREYLTFYIGGEWTAPDGTRTFDVVNPATEEVGGKVAAGSAADVDRAVAAARAAFSDWSETSRESRLELLGRIGEEYQRRAGDLAAALTEEMGAPDALAEGFQVQLGAGHLATAIEVLKAFPFEERRGATLVVREPIGVCGLITPWNWPMNQIAVKVFPALAAGCTTVLKPSEKSPFTGQVFAEILDAAGVPAGVFNLIQGDGPSVGAPLAAHPGVDMISFTGSTRAGVDIARNAAPSVKRVTQELGGKSPNIVLDDGAFATNVAKGAAAMMANSGQTCSAPSRMLVPHGRMAEATGGTGRPDGLERGYYVKPTVFADVSNDMTIAREEIFGPVLAILGYDSVDHAVEIANDTEYGLAGYVAGADLAQARAVARRIRAGWVAINDGFDFACPFGGYKKSGNGREWGEFGFHDYLEVKGILGYAP